MIWSLSTNFFPEFFPGYAVKEYVLMGIIATILLFVSVILHELSHSLVAKLRNIPVESITLFFFGGVAGINDEDIPPSSEFLMAIAGPLFSLILAGVFFLLTTFSTNVTLIATTFYLYQVNLVLALFNLIPGFPLDGGRAFRALLYWYSKDLERSTWIAVWGGKIFAVVLVLFGIIQLISQSGSGLWLLLLGGFIYIIAGAGYEQVLYREILNKVYVQELMSKKFITLKPEMKFSDFTQRYSNSEQEVFIVKDKTFCGILDMRRIQKTSPEVQERITLQQLSLPLNLVRGLQKTDTAYTAFKRFTEEGQEVLPVYSKSKVVGYLTRTVLMHRLIWGLKYGVKSVSKVNKTAKKEASHE
jgi:Zn-dependent protease